MSNNWGLLHIALDNPPGGWNAALYTFNLNEDNTVDIDETNIPFVKATFMPTTSAFGVKVTRENVAKTWEYYQLNSTLTPFDEVHGMEENEEHVKISEATKNYLIQNVLRPDFSNTVRPIVRSGQMLNQKVKGKMAVTSRQNMTLGGYGNSLTLESGADVVASAGQSITLSPGFTARAGAKFVAKTENITYSTVLRTADLVTKYVDYTQLSPYTGIVYNYQEDKALSGTASDLFGMAIYPNPLKGLVTIALSGLEEGYVNLQISNSLGQIVHQSNRLRNGTNTVDLSSLDPGIYFVKVTYDGAKVKTSKIIKL